MQRILILTAVLFLVMVSLAVLTSRIEAPESPAATGPNRQNGQNGPAAALGAGGPVETWPTAPAVLPPPMPDIVDAGPAGPALERILDLHIQRDQSFYEAMQNAGVRHEEILALVGQVRPFRDLRKVRAGERFRLELGSSGRLAAFGFDLDLESWVRYVRQADGTFLQHQGAYPVERRLVGVSGTIETSLYEALRESGAPLNLAAKMNDILGWDLDFSRDPRRGDGFRIVYEEVYKDGELVRTGAIRTCRYTGRDRDLAAYLFALGDGKTGYFDRDGRNLQKQLMRAPLNYSRISSGFSYNRRHPVLGRNMPHLGIDYAAPVGTPVWAAGDGKVIEMGHDKANGRYVRLRHTNSEYETYYLHFSRFASGLRVGRSVRQGEVIGYVGATGYATGPHLDFRVKKSGRFVNPRTLKLPPAEPVPADQLAGFLAVRLEHDAALEELRVPSPQPVPVMAATPVTDRDWPSILRSAGVADPPLLEAAN